MPQTYTSAFSSSGLVDHQLTAHVSWNLPTVDFWDVSPCHTQRQTETFFWTVQDLPFFAHRAKFKLNNWMHQVDKRADRQDGNDGQADLEGQVVKRREKWTHEGDKHARRKMVRKSSFYEPWTFSSMCMYLLTCASQRHLTRRMLTSAKAAKWLYKWAGQ